MATGSRRMSEADGRLLLNMKGLTHEDVLVKVFPNWWGILLKVSGAVVVRAVTLLVLESIIIFNHLLVQSVEAVVRDNVLNDHKSVAVKAANRYLQISRGEATFLDFIVGWTD